MRYGSICSGIEAATCAWHQLGWTPAWFAEIEPFPSAVLAHHYPEVPNLGDMTKLAERILAGEVEAPDLLVGGTPCQAFSVAGLRKGLADDRGKLTPAFALLADAIDEVRAAEGKPPVIIVWENVPGVLSDKDNAYGCFLGLLAGEDIELQPPGGRWTNAGLVLGPTRQVAWRVLDAQYFGVAQRRRRVFLVASARGSGVYPAQVLFVEQGVRRDPVPRRTTWEEAAAALGRSPAESSTAGAERPRAEHLPDEGGGNGGDGGDGVVPIDLRQVVAPTLTAANNPSRSPQSSEVTAQVVAILHAEAYRAQNWDGQGTSQTLATRLYGGNGAQQMPDKGNFGAVLTPICARESGQGFWMEDTVAGTLRAEGENRPSRPSHIVGLVSPVAAGAHPPAVAFTGNPVVNVAMAFKASHYTRGKDGAPSEVFPPLSADADKGDQDPVVHQAMAVRRLTAVECERLQGFPDDYTAIPWRNKTSSECPDGPRYKALGNSMAVPVMRWLGNRINNRSQP